MSIMIPRRKLGLAHLTIWRSPGRVVAHRLNEKSYSHIILVLHGFFNMRSLVQLVIVLIIYFFIS